MNSTSWKRNNSHASRTNRDKKEEKVELLTFGYSCKLFNDDNQAKYLDQGKNLIPWMEDESLLIDRFDVRGYLYPNDLKKYESDCDKDFESCLTSEELDFENKLNEERYKNLFILQEQEHEKELKRLNACLEEDSKKFNQIEFNYDNIEENKKTTHEDQIRLSLEKNDYVVPNNLNLPKDIQTPNTMKFHNLIEKTAKFISKHGIQMEILLKIKQASNVQFDFLNFDSPLNKYYKYLIEAFKQGNYQVQTLKKNIEENEDSNANLDEESDNEDYLHPSLLSSKQLDTSSNLNTTIPTFAPIINEQSLYSKLAKNLKEKIIVNEVYNESKIIEAKEIKYNNKNFLNNSIKKEETKVSLASLLPEIPNEIKIIIEKLAQYVARNGEEFEETVRNRNEERFSFLNDGHKFHFHYIKTKLKHLEEKKNILNKLHEKNKQLDLQKKSNENKLCKNKAKNQQSSHENQLTAHEIEKCEKERLLKAKQEERRRKAAIFLTSLKNRPDNKELCLINDQNQKINNEPVIFGPELPPSEEELLKRMRNTPSPLVEHFNDLDAQNSNKLSFSLINLKKNKLYLDENENDDKSSTIFKKISRSINKTTRKKSDSVESENNYKNKIKSRSKEEKYRKLKHHYRSSHYSRSRSNSKNRHSRSHSRCRYSRSPKSKSSRSPKSKSSRSPRKYRSYRESSSSENSHRNSKSYHSSKHKKIKR